VFLFLIVSYRARPAVWLHIMPWKTACPITQGQASGI
jgi:hypothetical protein